MSPAQGCRERGQTISRVSWRASCSLGRRIAVTWTVRTDESDQCGRGRERVRAKVPQAEPCCVAVSWRNGVGSGTCPRASDGSTAFAYHPSPDVSSGSCAEVGLSRPSPPKKWMPMLDQISFQAPKKKSSRRHPSIIRFADRRSQNDPLNVTPSGDFGAVTSRGIPHGQPICAAEFAGNALFRFLSLQRWCGRAQGVIIKSLFRCSFGGRRCRRRNASRCSIALFR